MADDADAHVARGTAPQTPFGWREIRIGLAVLAIGLALTFVLPAVLTL